MRPIFPPDVAPTARHWTLKGGVLPYTADDTLHLFRPPSSLRGIAEKTWSIDLPQLGYHVDMFALDVFQDLLILSARPRQSESFQLHLLSLGSGGMPHSRATHSVLRGPVAQSRAPSCRYIAVSEDIVVWKVCDRNLELQVWEWTTGTLLWRHTSPASLELALLNSSFLLLLLPQEHEFRIYSIDAWRRTAIITELSNIDHCVCALKLPPLVRRAELSATRSSMEVNIPTWFPDTCPDFLHDSTQSIITFQFALSINGHDEERFLLFIPITTMLSQVWSRNEDIPTSRTVQWEDWGPLGTRLFLLRAKSRPQWISTLGSMCALAFPVIDEEDFDSSISDVFVLHMHPSAALRRTRDPRFESRLHVDDNVGSISRLLRSDVYTSLPYCITYRNIYIKPSLWPMHFCLTEDGITFIVDPEEDEPGGFLGFSV